MPSELNAISIYRSCGFPDATPAETTSWNLLETGGSASSFIKVGLFGYDMTCFAGFCQEI